MTDTKCRGKSGDSSSGSESSGSEVKHDKWKEGKEERKKKREQRKKEREEKWEERKKEKEEKWDERKKEREEKKKHKDHKSGHCDASLPHSGGDASPYHQMTQGEQPHFSGGVGGYHQEHHLPSQPYEHRAGGEYGISHHGPEQPTPPPYVPQNRDPPPSGYRIPLTTQMVFPVDLFQTGLAPFIDADCISPIFIGSALMERSVHPCKVGPHLNPFASVPYGGGEYGHQGRFDLLPFRLDQMEWVHTSGGRIPSGRRPIEGGYEEDGRKLYHAVAFVNGFRVPGKTGEHLLGARIPFGGIEHEINDNYEILCWLH